MTRPAQPLGPQTPETVRLGRALMVRRIELGLKQSEVGRRCNRSEATVSRTETGRNSSLHTVLAIAHALQANIVLCADADAPPLVRTHPGKPT